MSNVAILIKPGGLDNRDFRVKNLGELSYLDQKIL
jgi:hypothetical protein